MAGRIRTFPPRLCDELGCEEVHVAQGRCRKHYTAWRASDSFTHAPAPLHRIVETSADGLTGVCSHCGPVDITMRPRKLGGRRPVCLTKAREYSRKRRKDIGLSPEKRAARNEYHAKYARATKYGMTIPELDALMANELACEICATELTPSTAYLDHDHACCPSGQRKGCGNCLRGILCEPCNYGLGFFRDNPDRLRSAIDYLASGRSSIVGLIDSDSASA